MRQLPRDLFLNKWCADELCVSCSGIPALYFCLLYRSRNQIRLRDDNGSPTDQEAIAHLRFLFDSYEPRCMYFEIVETFRKLLLTGGCALASRSPLLL